MKKLIMTKGLIASGKTTRAREMVAKFPGQFKRVNKDDLRLMIDGGRRSKCNEQIILRIRDSIIIDCLLAKEGGASVIVDDTNLDPKHEERLRELAKTYKAKFEIMEFNTPLEECIARDARRESPIGEDAIMKMYNSYLRPATPEIQHYPELETVVICDIDGTLADNNGRNPYDWEKVSGDLPIEETVCVVRLLSDLHSIVITTGRMEQCRAETEKRLAENNIPFTKLLMRTTDDGRKDSIVKKEMYENEIKGKYNVRFVIDDRPQVVDMRRSLGLFVFDVNQTGTRF